MTSLRDIIARRGRKQKDLIDLLGRDKSSVSRYVKDPHQMSGEQLRAVADFLNCSVAHVLGEVDLDTAVAGHNRNTRTRHELRQALISVDQLSIRALRECMIEHGLADETLRRLDDYARDLREELEAAI